MTDNLLYTLLKDPDPFYGRGVGVAERGGERIFVRRTDATTGVVTSQAGQTFLGFDALPQGWSWSRRRHPFRGGLWLVGRAARTWGRGRTTCLSHPRRSSTPSKESQKRRSLITHGLGDPLRIQALFGGHVEGQIDSNTWGLEVRMADSTMYKVREGRRLSSSLGVRSIAMVVRSIRSSGTCVVCRMSWRWKRAKDRGKYGRKA